MAITVSTNLTNVSISSVGVSGVNGTSGTSGNTVDISSITPTSSFNLFTSSQNEVNFGVSIVTSSIDVHILKQSIQTGSQDLINYNNSVWTGSIRIELNSIEEYTASLKGHSIVSSSQQISNYYKFAETASANTFYGTQTISGSFNVSGSTIQNGNNTLTGNTTLSGSINISGSTTFNGVHTLSGSNTIVGNTLMTGTNTIIGNTEMSGSINVSGSSNFHNSLFIVTGSSYFTGSHFVDGNSVFSGNINIASGSSYYRAGNKLFNYGQWASVRTQSGSANTAYAMKFDTKLDGSEGVSITNNGSGFPTRLTIENKGLYNIQFSAQLHTTANEACDFSVWFAMTGSNMENSNTDFSIEKVAGGGFATAALNFLSPVEANDWIELYWSNTTGNGQLQYKAPQSTPNRPATPSVIVTITQVA